jgi:uncharacterized membrane protein (UPF0127 family)
MPSLTSANGRVLVPNVAVSKAFGRGNAKGLLGRDGIAAGDGLLLSDPLGMIHMFFMRFPIDAVFLTSDLRVVRVAAGLRPWRVARAGGARRILEIGAGEADRLGIQAGDQLRLVEDGD